ncbi:MAG: adenylate/guanylate cyclase domain-containing protein [Planctomycetia bacterium]|nr:adenylate/guanylate cyclase domain-containing protein [Planctomycetia bacterium]
MADLEALTRIDPTTSGPPGSGVMIAPGQYSWRYTLPEKKLLRLGSDPAFCDWVVPEDRMISRFHATLEWDGSTLTVTRRGVMKPDFPSAPQNQIWYHNRPVEKCEVRPGEWFVIGQTRFTVRGETDSDPDCPVDATVVQREEGRSRAELENVVFSNPGILLKAVEQLPAYLKVVATEAGLFRQMLKVALSAMPRADAAAIVRIPPDCPVGELRVTVIEQNVRNPSAGTAGEFVPSRRLIKRVVCDQRKSCLHVWSTDPTDFSSGSSNSDHNLTLGVMHQQGVTPWAICTPFQDGSQHALYISGRITVRNPTETKPDASHLPEYQKFIEILVALLETTRRTLRLTRQLTVTKEAWPYNLRKHLDDPDKLEALLRPRERDVTVLFCDLRGFTGYAEEQGESLSTAWEVIQRALDTMSNAVTEKGGIVAGFRGDAVLGFWGWPDQHIDQIERAADAALRIFERLAGRMVQRRCGLGITHGRALAGRLGAHDLAVVDLYGPVVNLAFRLEEMTKALGVGIVVSDEVAKKLQSADPNCTRWRLRTLGNVRPRGMKKALGAFELAPPSPIPGLESMMTGDAFEDSLRLWNEAVELFTRGEWSEAAARLYVFTDDPAARCIMRHMARTKGVAPQGWDGAFLPRPEET